MNPYLLDLPAVVSFSGGRTSGYMLRHILDAYEGQPDDLVVCFQNTGLEHPATYEFIRDCSERWGVEIVWLEYCLDEEDKHSYQVVNYETASRKGEPFTTLIHKKQYLPNPVARICTVNLKMRTMDRYIKTLDKFKDGYTNAVGLRADEPRRVHRLKNDNSREETTCPLYHAGVGEPEVLDFWSKQDFDLMLPLKGNMAGNCVGCFLKGNAKLQILMQEMPEHFDWWVKAEQIPLNTKTTGGRFRKDRPSYAGMLEMSERQGVLPFGGALPDDDTIPCMCHD